MSSATSTLDPAQALEDYDRWLHARANQMLPPDTFHRGTAIDRSDLVQVGRVALWHAAETFDPSRGAAPAYLTMRAQGAMRDALRAREKHVVNDLVFDINTDDQASPVDLDELLLTAYHGGDIADAISTLTPRQQEYVRLRFWGGRTSNELTEVFGYDPRGVWAGAKRKLAARLEHLRDGY